MSFRGFRMVASPILRFGCVFVSRAAQDAQIYTETASSLVSRLSKEISKSSAVFGSGSARVGILLDHDEASQDIASSGRLAPKQKRMALRSFLVPATVPSDRSNCRVV